MLRVNEQNEIELTRGDTAFLTVPIVNDLTGEEYIMEEDDTLTLTIKRSVTDKTPTLQKTAHGENTFHIRPEDTAGCDFAKYRYDVQLTRANGDVYTVIVPTTFRVGEEVTY